MLIHMHMHMHMHGWRRMPRLHKESRVVLVSASLHVVPEPASSIFNKVVQRMGGLPAYSSIFLRIR